MSRVPSERGTRALDFEKGREYSTTRFTALNFQDYNTVSQHAAILIF
jgi:hypothetical protein